jgi:hypothetical protein
MQTVQNHEVILELNEEGLPKLWCDTDGCNRAKIEHTAEESLTDWNNKIARFAMEHPYVHAIDLRIARNYTIVQTIKTSS